MLALCILCSPFNNNGTQENMTLLKQPQKLNIKSKKRRERFTSNRLREVCPNKFELKKFGANGNTLRKKMLYRTYIYVRIPVLSNKKLYTDTFKHKIIIISSRSSSALLIPNSCEALRLLGVIKTWVHPATGQAPAGWSWCLLVRGALHWPHRGPKALGSLVDNELNRWADCGWLPKRMELSVVTRRKGKWISGK